MRRLTLLEKNDPIDNQHCSTCKTSGGKTQAHNTTMSPSPRLVLFLQIHMAATSQESNVGILMTGVTADMDDD
jgi:hypothetical protein